MPVASSPLPAALALSDRVLSAASSVSVEALPLPITNCNVLAPLKAAASTAFCRRVLFSNI
ncbi:hypothetical protein D3C84_1216410 [compost metagenome]